MLAGFAGDDAPRAVFPSILLVQQTVEIPQLQFICVVVLLPDVTHMPSLMAQTARRTIEIPELLVYKVVNVPVMRDVLVPRVRRGEDSCSHSCSLMRKAFLLCVVMSLVCRPCRSCRFPVVARGSLWSRLLQVCRSCRFPRRGARQFMVQTVRLTMDILRYVAMSLLCGCAAPQVQVVARPEVVDFPSWRRGSPHGHPDHGVRGSPSTR